MFKSPGLLLAMLLALAARVEGHEIEDLFGPKSPLSMDLTPPEIKAAPGFTARIFLGHGQCGGYRNGLAKQQAK